MKILLMTRFDGGFVAALENADGDTFDLFRVKKGSSKAACLRAAAALRELADRYDKLANEPTPCAADVQDRVNSRP